MTSLIDGHGTGSPQVEASDADLWSRVAVLVVNRARGMAYPCLVGLCGPQGSGKSTGATILRRRLEAEGLRTAMLSLDDLYLSRVERCALATKVHPLLATRGPPGTHDVGLGERTIGRLLAGLDSAIPAFDKAVDDRRPESHWGEFKGPADVVLFEGWCVGASPQQTDAMLAPLNDLERDQDPNGVWRRYVNEALESYQLLFSRIDLLIQLHPADFGVVTRWRCEQEAELRARSDGRAGLKIMSDEEIVRFVQHYERLTRHMLEEMPDRADVVAHLGPNRELKRLVLS